MDEWAYMCKKPGIIEVAPYSFTIFYLLLLHLLDQNTQALDGDRLDIIGLIIQLFQDTAADPLFLCVYKNKKTSRE